MCHPRQHEREQLTRDSPSSPQLGYTKLASRKRRRDDGDNKTSTGHALLDVGVQISAGWDPGSRAGGVEEMLIVQVAAGLEDRFYERVDERAVYRRMTDEYSGHIGRRL
jgi:hypothetical protein